MKRRPQLERIDISAEEHGFVRRRVQPFLHHTDRPLIDLLGDAYCQGLTDAANTLQGREVAP